MEKLISLLVYFFTGLLILCSSCQPRELAEDIYVASPNNKIEVHFFMGETWPGYWAQIDGNMIIDSSRLGMTFQDKVIFSKLNIDNVEEENHYEEWSPPWGEERTIISNYNQLRIEMSDRTDRKRKLNLIFRVFDEGFAFRYEFPEKTEGEELIIMDENSEFRLTGDHQTWWTPGDWDSYEHTYIFTDFSQIDALARRDSPDLIASYIPSNAVNTPVTMKSREGYYLSFHEAALTGFPGMTLGINTAQLVMESRLVGSDNYDYKARVRLPFKSPWRTVQLARSAGDLIESRMILNLNEPNKIGGMEWFVPKKYAGIWWEMHLGISTWKMEGGKHGATTENAKKYIHFASENGIKGVLIEGWNTGWEKWIGFPDRAGVFDFVTPYTDYDIREVIRYAKEKEVEIIMHHETSAAVRTYEQQMDTAFSLMKALGINTVKTGYVGSIIPTGEYHHGQYMVGHYHSVLQKAAAYQIAINAHEPIKPTGKRRTYPNAISREGVRGQEFNAGASDGGNSVDHTVIIPYTRMLAGPIDYTPGIFNLKLKPSRRLNQVKSTLAHQLGLYVVIYSPVQMVADLPEHYEGEEAFQFIKDVAVDWEQSRVLDGEIGEFIVMARHERDSPDWFVGGITGAKAREYQLVIDFLAENRANDGTLYHDAGDSHWEKNPQSYVVKRLSLSKGDTINIKMAPGGGFALSLLAQ